MRRASPLSIGATVVVAAVAVLGFAFTRHSEAHQEHALLQGDTSQAALYAGSVFGGVGQVLDPLATGVELSKGDPATFVQQASAFARGPVSLVLAERGDQGAYVAAAAVGPAYRSGQTLPAVLSGALARAGLRPSATQVVFDGHTSTAGFAVGPPLVPAGFAVYMQFAIDPFLPSRATAAKSFSMLDAALYGASKPTPSTLLVATTHRLPLTGDVARARTTVGTSTWTLVASARSPLVGRLASLAPFIILALGLVLALAVGTVIEVLDRRRRFAADMVAKRTGELERSLGELRDAQQALVRGERLTAVGEMASVVGHELRNPLAAVTNALYLLRSVLGEPAAGPIEKHLAMAERETAKAASLAEDLTAFVRPREARKEQVALEQIVQEVVEAAPPPAEVSLELDVDPVRLEADHRQLAEILTNLVTNAYQAVEPGGSVRISCHLNGAGAVVRVEDTGPGIDEAQAEQLFEPFFTTKHDGTGLGLPIVRRLVEAHDGEVTMENREDRSGARVVVRLPVGDPV